MTTFQESQPQSRRAARESERAEHAGHVDFTANHPVAPAMSPPQEIETADTAAGSPDLSVTPVAGGRRAAAPAGTPSAVTEQIVTQTLRDRDDGEATSAIPLTAQSDDVMTVPRAAVHGQPTMTRRELRALEAQREAAIEKDAPATVSNPQLSVGGESVPPALIEPVLIEPTAPGGIKNHPAAIDETVGDEAIVDEVQVTAPVLSPFDSLFQVPAMLVEPIDRIAPVAPANSARSTPYSALVVEPPLPEAVPREPLPPKPVRSETASPEPVAEVNVGADPDSQPFKPAELTWSPPIGHWSVQSEIDADAPDESNISRSVGSGILTTSALVLPSIPDTADVRGPLTGTGGILRTGSIDMPRVLSATGQSDRFDGDSMDALFDLNDAEVISTDSAPVRAIRAVSTHTSANGVTHTQKPKGSQALTGLLIAASSLAVVVAGLLVAAFAFNVF